MMSEEEQVWQPAGINNMEIKAWFDYFQQLTKQGWKIELHQVDQLKNGYWHTDKQTSLPYPDPSVNRYGDTPVLTFETFVYRPGHESFVDELANNFDSPMQAYKWLFGAIHKYLEDK